MTNDIMIPKLFTYILIYNIDKNSYDFTTHAMSDVDHTDP